MATANIADKVVNVRVPQATQHPSFPRIGHATAIGIAADQRECARKVDRRIHQRLHAHTVTTRSDKKAQTRRATGESGGDEVWESAVTKASPPACPDALRMPAHSSTTFDPPIRSAGIARTCA